MNFLRGVVVGSIVGALLVLVLIRPDPRSQAAHDRAVARAHVLEVQRETVKVRDRALRVFVTDTLPGRVDTLTRTIVEAAPEIAPQLDSLNTMWRSALDRAMAQASMWRAQDSSTALELDSALAREARLLKQRKASPLALTVGVALTPRGVQPALTVGFRVPLPRLF